ncbi:hypothetical protein EZS27_009745, partial [termite gut metagenome]
MPNIKKLDIFVVKSYVLLFAGTFVICLFIFMMQFLWRYVDDMVGKGLEVTVLAQFFFYAAISLVPVSLPLAILLASLITFGNFGERYELLAMKASGVSLLRIIRPLAFFVILLGFISFLFQNVMGPYAESKLYTLILSMRQKSPELDIPEGVFYDQIKGYNLYVKKKDRKTGLLYDVVIYNFSDGFENAHIIRADTGKLEMTADKKHLYFHLYSGEMFENLKAQNANSTSVPYWREIFREKHSIIQFDSEFSMIDASFMNSRSNSKNMKMLQASIDSMTVYGDSLGRKYYTEFKNDIYQKTPVLYKEDTLQLAKARISDYNVDSIFDVSTLTQKQHILSSAVTRTGNLTNDWNYKSYTITSNDMNIRRHVTDWHKKITLSLACVIFFFIGTPLGAIIRKGGLGMPVVISVFIFIFYYVMDNTCYKLARDGNWITWIGMWASTAVLVPIGAFFTYKSNNDSVVVNIDAYINSIKRAVGIRDVRNLTKKEVIITDPDYRKVTNKLKELNANCKAYVQSRKYVKQVPNYIRLWVNDEKDEKILFINNQLESLVEEM